MRTSEVAAQAQVNAQTLRRYERRGLLPEPEQGGPASCDDARTMAHTRIAEMQMRIDELVGMRDALGRLVDTCDQPRAERDCPILRDIESAATTTTFTAQA